MNRRIRVVRDDPALYARKRAQGAGGTAPERTFGGLPGPLPAGETLLWQGCPDWRVLLRRALHVRLVIGYFAILMGCCLFEAVSHGSYLMWFSLATLAGLAPLVIGIQALFAYLVARTTVYTLTDKRIVLKLGVALSMSINLPFKAIEAASLRLNPDGSGDIPVLLEGLTRIGFTQLWPHVRPWRMNRVQPMLRAIPDARRVAQLLAAALAASTNQAVQPVPATQRAPETVPLAGRQVAA
ncbi:photosynthetic complex putative assembly protein PuhB [Lichenicoccus sp.]|uniref:photosynthetic complex putative assembly protein PuhB n=1 Tax=Lichenicoccus sp. TaxID=2781899 RepID=UPI003D0E0855